jgi:hypothetical protein
MKNNVLELNITFLVIFSKKSAKFALGAREKNIIAQPLRIRGSARA